MSIPKFEGIDVTYKAKADNKDIRDLLVQLVPKASGGKYPVIDIFFLNKKDAIKFANSNPKIVKVEVFDRI